jgi:peptidyl-prolyl cis-trans isomerase A (cyclophilin A)
MKTYSYRFLVAAAAIAIVTLPALASEALMNPADLNATAPETFKVKFETSKGDFVVEVQRDQAPIGADRFYNLVQNGFFDDVRFFRVLPGFVAQFGLNGDPKVNEVWREARIKDDPVKGTNAKGTLTFATAGPDTRTTQLFINLVDNQRLDGMGFAPFGKVVEGMDVVDKLYGGYGEGAPRGRGPNQGAIVSQGNEYLKKNYPDLDYIKSTTVLESAPAEKASTE